MPAAALAPGMRLDDVMDIVRACRRSRVKYRVYGALIVLRIATPAELADKAKTTPERVHQVMIGDGTDYRRRSSLLALRVSERRGDADGDAYAITVRGDEAFALVKDRLER